jgi:hypothetical protein
MTPFPNGVVNWLLIGLAVLVGLTVLYSVLF